MIALFGGAAGSGKTTVAKLWSDQQQRAVHIELDDVRDLIASGRADPQVLTEEQSRQYMASVRACCAIAKSWASDGFAVAIGDVFEPAPTRDLWFPCLREQDVRLVILHPSLDVSLAREAARGKGVMEQHIRAQHEAVAQWPERIRVESSDLSPMTTLASATRVLENSSLVDLIGDV